MIHSDNISFIWRCSLYDRSVVLVKWRPSATAPPPVPLSTVASIERWPLPHPSRPIPSPSRPFFHGRPLPPPLLLVSLSRLFVFRNPSRLIYTSVLILLPPVFLLFLFYFIFLFFIKRDQTRNCWYSQKFRVVTVSGLFSLSQNTPENVDTPKNLGF